MKHLFTSIILGVSIATAVAQNTTVTPLPASPQQQQPITDVKVLEARFKQTFEANRQKAEEIARATGIQLRTVLPATGQIREFAGFSANGQMLFNQTQNIGAGRTISTNKVWPGGSVGTALTGSGMTNRLGEWDGGAVLTTHQELNGRVIQVDGASQLSDHATHVAGTMIAAGVDANAKGMAYQATLKAYDWNSDESEMAVAAGAGMLVSNHSYGTICGWEYNSSLSRWEWWGDAAISAVEDYKFGLYDQGAADWDDIAFNNPYYLICKAAGNDRGNQPTNSDPRYVRDASFNWIPSSATRNVDGNTNGFDCIASTATAKNILTVGAVNKIGSSNNNNGWTQVSDVVMSSFSGWGPTDDGRIKPDVVACGVNLYSSFSGSNTDYSSISGTSMATPNATGSLLLVQQHYNNLKAKFMRSATLKALIIHTADEAGNAGPDYTYGWGLVNTAKAVKLITDSNYNQIQERTLANGATYTQGVSSDGTAPLRVTIVWTDRQGTPPAEALDPTNKMLVNDLDIRIKRNSDNVEFSPFVLNPASPAAVATTGDNTRDNVEQVLIAAPQPGAYTITVKHKGTLFGSQAQNYSLIIGGIVGNPAASFSANVQSICAGQSVQYTDNSGGNPTSRVWYFPGGVPSTATTSTVNVTYPNPGSYPVAIKVTNPLGSDSTYISGYVKVGGLTLPFLETFESNSTSLNAWLVDNPNADSTWRLAEIGGTTPGSTAAAIPFFNMNNVGTRDGLISPPLNFKGFQNVSLSLKHSYSGYPSNPTDSLVIWVSTNCGNTWTRVKSVGENGTNNFATAPATLNEFGPATAGEWCSSNCITVNLSAYDGQSNVKIKFEGYNSFGNDLYIDNINVTGTALKPVTKFGTPLATVCAGNPVAFFDSTDNNPSTWQWTFTGATAASSTLQNPSVVYNTPGTYTVKLKTTNGGGADSLIKTNYITVIPSPTKPNITSAGPGICIGDSVMLSTDSVNTGYQWFHNNIAIGGAAAANYYATISGTYKVNIIAGNGCGTSSDPINIISGPKPDQPVITDNLGGGTSFCSGATITLTSSANSGNQWYKNGVKVPGGVNKLLNIQDSGTYTVVSTINGCSSDPAIDHALQKRTKPVTSAISGSANVHYHSVEAYSVTNTSGSTYQWFITGGTLSSGAGTSSVSVTWGTLGTGSVVVKETAANGCFGDNVTLNITLTPPVGLEQLSFFSNISVFPNPVSDQLTVSFNGTMQKEVSVKVINILGQTMSEDKLASVNNGYQHKMDISKLNPGIYFVEVSNAEGSKVIKVTRK